MLHVVGRRADGYHELQTVFQLIDLCDRIEITRPRRTARSPGRAGPAGVAGSRGPGGPGGPGASAGSAAPGSGPKSPSRRAFPWAAGWAAAARMPPPRWWRLNQLWRTWADFASRSRQLARRLGADVPVFVAGSSAWAEGIGERLTPVSLGADSWYLVIFPGVACRPPRYSRLLN